MSVSGESVGTPGGRVPTPEEVAQVKAEVEAAANADYLSGRWCGECEWRTVQDPPCCYPARNRAQRRSRRRSS